MGTKFAPAFANIFMADLERLFLQSVPSKPWIWWRFLDDIIMIWTHGEVLLDEFLTVLNSFRETIKFTWSISNSSVAYLDVLVSLSEGSITTDLYCKPTDTHQYLDKRSCHPNYVKRAIPYSQALRTRRICSKTTDFKARTREMKTWFKAKGYKAEFLDLQIARAGRLSRVETLKRKQPVDDRRKSKPLILNFHPSLSGARSIINDLYPILASTAITKEVFPSAPFVSFRRPKNLKDNLVRAKLPKLVESSGLRGMHPCGKSRCQICRLVSGLDTFQDSDFKHTYFINYKFDCDSTGVIYLLSCKKCKKFYIGSTTDSFRRRFNNHKSSLNRYGRGQREMPGEHLYAHFFSDGHEGLVDLCVNIIDKTDIHNPTNREAYWTYRLNCFTPKGLNLRDFIM